MPHSHPSTPLIFPAISLQISVVIGGLLYALRDSKPNMFAGIRTPRTLSNPQAWAEAHAIAGKYIPPLSALCAAISVSAFWIPGLQNAWFLFATISIQIAALLLLAIRWW